jgi:hypothetical protein
MKNASEVRERQGKNSEKISDQMEAKWVLIASL